MGRVLPAGAVVCLSVAEQSCSACVLGLSGHKTSLRLQDALCIGVINSRRTCFKLSLRLCDIVLLNVLFEPASTWVLQGCKRESMQREG